MATSALTLALTPATLHAATYAARVRWQPGEADTTIAGYRVYLRSGDGTRTLALDAGLPAPAADGTVTALIDGLQPCVVQAFAVTSYRADGTESPSSNEIAVTYATAAALLDTDRDGLANDAEDRDTDCVVDPGETDPMRADTDGDGVGDATDTCNGTAAGDAVNPAGCSCAQVACDDGNVCNGVESCQAGICAPGTPLVCDDGNACTTQTCSATAGCVFAPIAGCTPCTTAAACDDGNRCTTDACIAGRCERTAAADGTSCDDGVFCNGAEVCRAGVCSAGTPVPCDDGDVCTTDACSEAARTCTATPRADCCTSDAQCDTGDRCRTNPRCESGSCAADPVVCPDPGPCATATCDPASGCVTTPLPDGTPCDDGDLCTTGEVCTAGACGAPVTVAARTALNEADAGVTPARTRLTVRTIPSGLTLLARTSFPEPADFDPSATDVHVVLRDDTGATRFDHTVPRGAFLSTGTSAVYRDDGSADGSSRTITLTRRSGRVFLSVRAVIVAPATVARTVAQDATSLSSATVEWSVRSTFNCFTGSGQCKGRSRRCRNIR